LPIIKQNLSTSIIHYNIKIIVFLKEPIQNQAICTTQAVVELGVVRGWSHTQGQL